MGACWSCLSSIFGNSSNKYTPLPDTDVDADVDVVSPLLTAPPNNTSYHADPTSKVPHFTQTQVCCF